MSIYDGTRAGVRASVGPSFQTFKHEYFCEQLANHYQISLEHYWGGCLAAVGFGLDQIRISSFHGNRYLA